MRLIFMGTPDFAVPTLKMLVSSDHELLAVVTQPDRPKGRGQVVQASPVKQIALDEGLLVIQPEKASNKEFIEGIRQLRSDMIIVVAYGQILKQEMLDLPKWFCMNLHASILPKYRGSAPINWPIINGDRETGITTMKMDAGLDTGDILLKKIVTIEDTDDCRTLHDKLALVGAKLILETIETLCSGKLTLEPQNNDEASYAPKLFKELGLIQWNKDAESLHNLVRGVSPRPGAYTFYQGKRLTVCKTETSTGELGETPGTIIRVTDNGLEVSTGKGRLIITELKPEGKRAMSVKSFLQGHKISPGDPFETTPDGNGTQ